MEEGDIIKMMKCAKNLESNWKDISYFNPPVEIDSFMAGFLELTSSEQSGIKLHFIENRQRKT